MRVSVTPPNRVSATPPNGGQQPMTVISGSPQPGFLQRQAVNSSPGGPRLQTTPVIKAASYVGARPPYPVPGVPQVLRPGGSQASSVYQASVYQAPLPVNFGGTLTVPGMSATARQVGFPRTISSVSHQSAHTFTSYQPGGQHVMPHSPTQVWPTEFIKRIWPGVAEFIGKQIKKQLQIPGGSPQCLQVDQMVARFQHMPVPIPVTSDWLNNVLKVFWPVISLSLDQVLKAQLVPMLRLYLKFLEPFDVDPCELGEHPPEISELKILQNRISEGWIDLSMRVQWHSDANIKFSCRAGSLGLPKLSFGATVFVSFYGLIPSPPFFEGFTVYLGSGLLPAKAMEKHAMAHKENFLGLGFEGVLSAFSSSLIGEVLLRALNNALGKVITLPHRISVLLAAKSAHIYSIVRPKPKGCLQVTLLGIKDLKGTDFKLHTLWDGERSNDPFVTVQMGDLDDFTFKSSTVYDNLNPEWEEENTYHFLLEVPRLQRFNIRVWDDGVVQQLRTRVSGQVSDADEIARKLSLNIFEILELPEHAPLDKEIRVDRWIGLDSWWHGRETGDEASFSQAQAQAHMVFHWRPITNGPPATSIPAVSNDDDDSWPTYLLRVGIGDIEQRDYTTGSGGDKIYVTCDVSPAMSANGEMHSETTDGITKKTTNKATPQLLSLGALGSEDTNFVVNRIARAMVGESDRDAVFNQAFFYLLRAPTAATVTLEVFAEPAFDPENPKFLGRLTKQVGSLLFEPDMIKNIKKEALDDWVGNNPTLFAGQLQLWRIGGANHGDSSAFPGGRSQISSGVVAKKAEEVAAKKAKARHLEFEAARFRAQAEELERQAREQDCEASRQSKSKILRVKVVSARGLRAADWRLLFKASSDPYCVCEIQGGAVHKSSSFKTHVVSKTLEPIWEYEAKLSSYRPNNALKFSVFDDDWGKSHDLLGQIVLDPKQFYPNGFAGELKLNDAGTNEEAYIEIKISDQNGDFPPDASQAEDGSKLKVTMVGARSLFAADWSLVHERSSDPYCSCEVHGKPKVKVRTQTMEKTLNPSWNHETKIRGYQIGDALKFTVFDEDWGKSDDVLGHIKVESSQFHPMGFVGELRLTDAGGQEAYIDVKISNADGEYPEAPDANDDDLVSKLKIKILGARGLRAADFSLLNAGSSDPYCVCETPGRANAKIAQIRTQAIEKTLKPEWNYESKLRHYRVGDYLKFRVFDEDWGTTDDLLGHFTLEPSQFYPNGFAGELRLNDAGKGHEAYLEVQISNAEGEFGQGNSAGSPAVAQLPSTSYATEHGSSVAVSNGSVTLSLSMVESLRESGGAFRQSMKEKGKNVRGMLFGTDS
ncbi:unnamed protein product [Polarella glacialis]|uniref:Calmodulin n=1 Tax=Polarella glacialis TaxID=89957 RepID=A0A813HXH5_POLGL|nr:unnamed protein product [Polarella glacialis]